jgi:hypothetical protein
MAGRNDSLQTGIVLTVASALIAIFQVTMLGRKGSHAALGFVLGVVVAVIIASILDVAREKKDHNNPDG